MTVPTTVGTRVAIGEESSYGVAAALAAGYAHRGETLRLDAARMESEGLAAGVLVLRSERWAPGSRGVEGDVLLEPGASTYGVWLRHMLGGASSTQPDPSGAPDVWRHTYFPAPLPTALTIQAARPDSTGAPVPFTYTGCRVSSWELACGVDEPVLGLRIGVMGREESTALALAAPPAPHVALPFHLAQARVRFAGEPLPVRRVDVRGVTPLNGDRYRFGSGLREKPLEVGWRAYGGLLDTDLDDPALYARYSSGVEGELDITFTGSDLGGLPALLRVVANVRVDGATPDSGDVDEDGGTAEPLRQQLRYAATSAGGAAPLRIEYQTTDSTP